MGEFKIYKQVFQTIVLITIFQIKQIPQLLRLVHHVFSEKFIIRPSISFPVSLFNGNLIGLLSLVDR